MKGTHHDSYKRLLELLVEHLRADIDTGQPTPVTRMTMIPPDHVLKPPNL